MLILGIESSCDETAASVAEDYTKIRSNVVASQVKEHQLYGGVVPEIASRRHCENVLPVVQKALDDAQVTLADLDGIAVDWGVAGWCELCQRFGTGNRKALSSRTSLSWTHRSELYCSSGIEAAVSLSGGKWRTQPYCRSPVLYPIPNCRQNTG